MNTSRDSLSETLQHWTVEPPADPGFRADVWSRIGRDSRESWPSYVRAHAAAWIAVAALMLATAAYTGHATAQARVRADRDALVVSYLVNLDPRVQASIRP